jgi:hypothetical protein
MRGQRRRPPLRPPWSRRRSAMEASPSQLIRHGGSSSLSPEDNNNPPTGPASRRSCTASPPSSTSPPLTPSSWPPERGRWGQFRGLRSAAAAEEELKVGSRTWPELEAREEAEAVGGGSGQKREEEVVRWLLG